LSNGDDKEGWSGAHEVALADDHAVVAQDVVGCAFRWIVNIDSV
jgi:hypothetical protein